MKRAEIEDANVVDVTDACKAVEYPLDDADINAVAIKINGRYPNKGRTVNKVCKELVYVLSGTGQVAVEGEVINLKKGSVVLIEPGERFYWEGNSLEMFMPCTPAWYPEQHKRVG